MKLLRQYRLLLPADFTRVFAGARRVANDQFTLLVRTNSLGYPRIGLAMSKKQFKLASQRNRVKRIARESFRLYAANLPSYDFVVIGKKLAIHTKNPELFALLAELWARV